MKQTRPAVRCEPSFSSPDPASTPVADSTLSRRGFLRTAGLAAGALLLVAPAAAQVAPSLAKGRDETRAAAWGKLYRGTANGLIFESVDQGATWEQVANLGPDYSVLALREVRGRLQARVGFAGYAFLLHSSDGRKWYSV